MKKIEKIEIANLTAHEKNSYFFDDLTGAAWDAFKDSISTDGVMSPILITDFGNIIISGHQRVRACKELGIEEIPFNMLELNHDLDETEAQYDDRVLLTLIETNLKQRGDGNPNPVKMGRCIKELERLYGIRRGGDRKSNPNCSNLITQKDLAEWLGMSTDTMINLKKLADMPDEVGAAIMNGCINATTACKVLRKLSEEDQISIVNNLDLNTQYSSGNILEIIAAMKDEKNQENMDVETDDVKNEAIPYDGTSAVNDSASSGAKNEDGENTTADVTKINIAATTQSNNEEASSVNNSEVEEVEELSPVFIHKDETVQEDHASVIKKLGEEIRYLREENERLNEEIDDVKFELAMTKTMLSIREDFTQLNKEQRAKCREYCHDRLGDKGLRSMDLSELKNLYGFITELTKEQEAA